MISNTIMQAACDTYGIPTDKDNVTAESILTMPQWFGDKVRLSFEKGQTVLPITQGKYLIKVLI